MCEIKCQFQSEIEVCFFCSELLTHVDRRFIDKMIAEEHRYFDRRISQDRRKKEWHEKTSRIVLRKGSNLYQQPLVFTG
jgi:hypothetical protein